MLGFLSTVLFYFLIWSMGWTKCYSSSFAMVLHDADIPTHQRFAISLTVDEGVRLFSVLKAITLLCFPLPPLVLTNF